MEQQDNKKFVYTYSAAEEKRAEQLYKTYQLSDDRFESAEKIDKRIVTKGKLSAVLICVVGVILIIVAIICITDLSETWFWPGLLIGISGLVNIVSGVFVGQLTIKLKRRLNASDVLNKLSK